MSYKPGQAADRLVMRVLASLIVVIVISAGALTVSVLRGGHDDASNSGKAEHAGRLDAFAAGDRQLGPLLQQMKTDFPEDYARLETETADLLDKPGQEEALRVAIFSYARHFMLVNFVDVEVAPSDNIKALRDDYIGVLTALRATSPAQCASYINGTLEIKTRLDPGSVSALTELTTAELHAVAAGRARPVERVAMTGKDEDAYSRVVGKALSPAQRALLADPKKLAAAPALQQCDIAVTMETAINSLPAATADKITTEAIRADAQPSH